MTSRATCPDSVIGTSEIAAAARVSPRTAAQWIDKGLLPGWKIPGSKTRRTTRRNLAGFLAAAGMPVPPGLGGAADEDHIDQEQADEPASSQ
jgi:hypothetical protein